MQTGTCMIVLMIFSVDIYICNVEGGHNGVKTVLKLHFSFWQRYRSCSLSYLMIVFILRIWMSHWCGRAAEGAKFWIRSKRPAFLSNFSRLQLIQNSAPSVARWRQCDIQIIVLWQFLAKVYKVGKYLQNYYDPIVKE